MLRLLSLGLPRAGGVGGLHLRTAQGTLLDLMAMFGLELPFAAFCWWSKVVSGSQRPVYCTCYLTCTVRHSQECKAFAIIN